MHQKTQQGNTTIKALSNWTNGLTSNTHHNYKTHPGIINRRKNDFPCQQSYWKWTHQTSLKCDTTNEHWGDQPTLNNIETANRLHIISCNINSISNPHQQLSWQAITQAALDIEANIICLQKMSTNWTMPILWMTGQIINKSEYKAHWISVSAGKAAQDSNFLPGGTLTVALGQWTAWLSGTGSDSHGLGRWSYITLQGSNNISYFIVSSYHVGPQQPKLGSITAYNQQFRSLLAKGHQNPQLQQQFIDDLAKQVRMWHQSNHKVLLCLDANKDIENLNPVKELGQLIANMDLADIHELLHPHSPCPTMHQQGSHPINVILASPWFIAAATAAYFLPFGLPVTMPGDHRTLGINLDTWTLFGNQPPPPEQHVQTRGVNFNAIPTVQRFCTLATKGWEKMNIPEQVAQLMSKDSLTPDDHHDLEQIDINLTNILVKADKQCSKFKATP